MTALPKKPKVNKRQQPQGWDRVHKYQLLLYLSMFSSGTLFLFILVAFYATKGSEDQLTVSGYFGISTSLLLLSSYPIGRLAEAYRKEKHRQLIKNLSIAAFSGALFILMQLVGWQEMTSNGTGISERANAFLMLLSGLHLLHIVTMVLVTTVFMYYYARQLSDPVKRLIFLTNPYEEMRLQLLSQSWVFLHILWVAIYLSFLLLK